MKPPKFLTIPEASEYLSITKQTLYQYCNNRVIPYYKPQGVIYISKEDLDNFIFNKDHYFRSNSQIESKATSDLVSK